MAISLSIRNSFPASLVSSNLRRFSKQKLRSAVSGNVVFVFGADKVLAKERGLAFRSDGVSAVRRRLSFRATAMEGDAGAEPLGPFEVETELLQPFLSKEEENQAFDWTAVLWPFFFPALGGVLFGYDIGATSGAAVSIVSSQFSGTDWYNLTALQTGLVVSGSLYGALLGSILAFNVADFLGRRKELILASLLYILGSTITSFAPNFAIVVLGRLLYGLGIGLSMHAAPMYIAETSPNQIRGMLISLKEAFIVGGILLGYLVGNNQIEAVGGWRVMFGFGAPIAALMGLGMWWLPPSPRYLLLRAVQGKDEPQTLRQAASKALQRLRGESCSQQSAVAETERQWTALQTGESANVSFSELFQGINLKALFVGAGLVFFQQFTGQPSVLYYAAPILQSAGFSAAADATKLAVLLGLFKLVMTAFAVSSVDKLGRRPLLLGGVAGITVSLATLAAYFSFLHRFPYLAVGSLLLYVGCYQISFGPISWLMVSEIFPLRTRGKALSVTTLVNFGSNAVVALAFAPLQDLVGESYTFVIFGIVSLVALGFIYTSVPETKGLSLEQITAKLKD